MVNPYPEILVDLKMEMRGVHSMVGADCPQLLSSGDLLALPDHDPVEMCIKGICKTELPLLDPCMSDDYDIAPRNMDVPSQYNDPVADRRDRVTEALCASPVGYPVLTEVASGSEPAGGIKALCLRRGYGQIETLCRSADSLRDDTGRAGNQHQQGHNQKWGDNGGFFKRHAYVI